MFGLTQLNTPMIVGIVLIGLVALYFAHAYMMRKMIQEELDIILKKQRKDNLRKAKQMQIQQYPQEEPVELEEQNDIDSYIDPRQGNDYMQVGTMDEQRQPQPDTKRRGLTNESVLMRDMEDNLHARN
jgi:hypothetical protein